MFPASSFPVINTISFARVQETLPNEVLTKMHAPPKAGYPVITPDILATYDAFLIGIPTRYGNMSAQWKVRCVFFIHYSLLTAFFDIDILGRHWSALGRRKARRKVRWCVPFNRRLGRRSRIHCSFVDVNFCTPWSYLCSFGLCPHLSTGN